MNSDITEMTKVVQSDRIIRSSVSLDSWMHYLKLAALSGIHQSDPSVLTSGQRWIYHCLSLLSSRWRQLFLYPLAACPCFPLPALRSVKSWKLITKPGKVFDLVKVNSRRKRSLQFAMQNCQSFAIVLTICTLRSGKNMFVWKTETLVKSFRL